MFGTLFYTVEEMNNDVDYAIINGRQQHKTYYEVSKVNISEKTKMGTAEIRDTTTGELQNWHWDYTLDLWIKDDIEKSEVPVSLKE